MADARGVLTPAQLAKVAVLEQALTLMPTVQSARSCQPAAGSVTGPPAGMPGGTLDVEFAYVRESRGSACRVAAVRRRWCAREWSVKGFSEPVRR